MEMSKISVIVPVYNEQQTLAEIIQKVQSINLDKEIIIVDDCSTDDTRNILKTIQAENIQILYHSKNQGKGAAIRTALAKVTGDIVIIQDADLEYDPNDYLVLIEPIVNGKADVVYGSRFLGKGPHRVMMFWHYFANVMFTLLTNMLYNINLTDMGTCYKVFRTHILKSIKLKSNRFGFEPEITAKICKSKVKIFETAISYSGRTYLDGKKISWTDSFSYLWCLVKYRFWN